ncbi:XRE family transcriptional regulator [Streptomyces chrestomyceticus]|uniref:XRE family transcriptional regulator n=1 Tax=Streptomyces chrestomyceticus TaxID=68185 RepID=UPI0033FC3A1B
MTRAHHRRQALELAEARARLVALLQETIGPALTASAAQSFLEQAKAWRPAAARALDRHISEHPDALTAPSSFCPPSLARLLRLLDEAGHGDAITLLGCARCGRTDREFRRMTPEGRCCGWCVTRSELKKCARCHQHGHIVTTRDEGPICRVCYRVDPLFLQTCTSCGRHVAPNTRRDGDTVLCSACAPKPQRKCARCGTVARVAANREEGPICKSCYDAPARPCGRCGHVRAISVRGVGGRPDICASCYSAAFPAECSVCGRVRPGYKVGGKEFQCSSCAPRPTKRCGSCGELGIPQTTWPLGPVCGPCYSRRRRNPGPCADCGATAVLVGRSDQGHDLCGPCAGADGLEYRCRRCDSPGEPYSGGLCTRCVVNDRVHDLLGDEAGTIPEHLKPLADALIGARHPSSVKYWIDWRPSAKLLAQLVEEQAELTHEHLDTLPRSQAINHIREVLVTTGVLPRRQEAFAQLQLWVKETLGKLPPHHQRIISPFAEWSIVRDARRRADRGRYTQGAATADRQDIRIATEFLTWLDDQNLKLSTVAQDDLDRWVTAHPTRRRGLHSFVRWTVARRLTGKLDLAHEPNSLPSQFIAEDEHLDQLKRCLNDDSIPLPARIAGALTRLYGLSTTRIVALTADRFHRDKDDAYLTIDRHPVLLPPKLARLIERQISGPGIRSVFHQAADETRFLLPGRTASKPQDAVALRLIMRKHGLPTLSARNTAMIEVVSDIPPIVASDLFGLNPSTTHRWAQFAQNSWAEYLAACAETEE